MDDKDTKLKKLEEGKDKEAFQPLTLRYEAILSAVPDIIMEVDSNKVYTWANNAGFEFFGDDVIGKEAAFYFEGEQETYTKVQPIFAGSKDFIYVESWQRRKDGERRLLAWWCRVLKGSSGNIIGALSTARDITESKIMESELKERMEELEKFYEMAVGRELKMKELKEENKKIQEEINKLKAKLSQYRK